MLTLVGRKKDMIIRNGINIYPLSFEPSILEITDRQGKYLLRDCALVGLWNPERQDEDVILCLQPASDSNFDLERVRQHAKRICGTDAKPDYVLVVDPIPVTGRQNKVDKIALRHTCAGMLNRPYIPPPSNKIKQD